MAGSQKKWSDEPEPLREARPRALKEQHLAAAPFGAWQVLPLSKHRERCARVWPVSLKQKPMLTHGSDCQRAWSGPLDALVGIAGVEEDAASARCPPQHLG